MKTPRDLSAERRALSFLRCGSLVRRSGGWRFGTARIPDAIVERVADDDNISLASAGAAE
jgi:hypothetical protein